MSYVPIHSSQQHWGKPFYSSSRPPFSRYKTGAAEECTCCNGASTGFRSYAVHRAVYPVRRAETNYRILANRHGTPPKQGKYSRGLVRGSFRLNQPPRCGRCGRYSSHQSISPPGADFYPTPDCMASPDEQQSSSFHVPERFGLLKLVTQDE